MPTFRQPRHQESEHIHPGFHQILFDEVTDFLSDRCAGGNSASREDFGSHHQAHGDGSSRPVRRFIVADCVSVEIR